MHKRQVFIPIATEQMIQNARDDYPFLIQANIPVINSESKAETVMRAKIEKTLETQEAILRVSPTGWDTARNGWTFEVDILD